VGGAVNWIARLALAVGLVVAVMLGLWLGKVSADDTEMPWVASLPSCDGHTCPVGVDNPDDAVTITAPPYHVTVGRHQQEAEHYYPTDLSQGSGDLLCPTPEEAAELVNWASAAESFGCR